VADGTNETVRILFCDDTFPAAAELLRQRLAQQRRSPRQDDEVLVSPRDKVEALIRGLGAVDVLIPLMSRLDSATLNAGSIRLIQQWGAGLEGVDLEAARSRGIWVANVPAAGKNADSVAEHVILLILALLRQLPAANASVRAGILGQPLGQTLSGKAVCLYGLGGLAKALVKRLRPFDTTLFGVTRDPAAAKVADFALDQVWSSADREACFAQTDVLVVCTPLTRDTRAMIDDQALAALRPGSYLVNAARGPVVEYEALYSALQTGHLAGAGLDVFWVEPIAPDDPLLALPNVIATPHVAGATDGSYAAIADGVMRNIERLRRGEPPVSRAV
jgi:phosphoglycerate dehydrogenase-like enzyme